MKIVSLHLPKTAGASFGKSLIDYFGDDLLRDYSDKPMSKSPDERNKYALQSSINIANSRLANVKCAHGHFLPIKYLLVSTGSNDIKFITWMRDPVDRMISHYNFWQRSYDPNTSMPHHKKVIEEEWTLEQFCLSPQFRNLYSQYLWAFPLRYFDFIGITEHFEEDLAYFSENYLSGMLNHYQINTANTKTTKSSIDSTLRKKIENYHNMGMDLYKRALNLRLTRQSTRTQ
jgi:hypothetical protein